MNVYYIRTNVFCELNAVTIIYTVLSHVPVLLRFTYKSTRLAVSP